MTTVEIGSLISHRLELTVFIVIWSNESPIIILTNQTSIDELTKQRGSCITILFFLLANFVLLMEAIIVSQLARDFLLLE